MTARAGPRTMVSYGPLRVIVVRTPQVAAVVEGMMSNTEQNSGQTEKDNLSERTSRPEGTVDEDANPPLTDGTETAVDRDQETVPPQDTASAVPPYEGRT